ncbi:hypothetical protein Tco_0329402 [Tanacetum coccineum]
MGGLSSQRRTNPAKSPINAFPVEELYTPQFLDSFQDNTGYWQEPNSHEYSIEQVATSPTKTKKPTRDRQKRTIKSDDAPCKHGNTIRQDGFLCEALQYIESKTKQYGRRTYDMMRCKIFDDQGAETKRDVLEKNKGSKASGSSTMNDDALAMLMVTEMTA